MIPSHFTPSLNPSIRNMLNGNPAKSFGNRKVKYSQYKVPYHLKVQDVDISKFTDKYSYFEYLCSCGDYVKIDVVSIVNGELNPIIVCKGCSKKFRVLFDEKFRESIRDRIKDV